jgi:heat shock protein HtpX
MAHELSHVANFDIRYSMIVAAMVGAIVLVSDGFRRSMFWGGGRRRSRGGKGGGAQGIFMLIALLLAIVAPIFALLLQMSISRKRELLADSNGVKFTRNPLGLASALEKISHSVHTDPLPAANRATQHLFIVNPLKEFSSQSSALFSTHPPTEERVNILRSMAGESAGHGGDKW